MIDRPPHTELLLAGDFSSPAEVLASDDLTSAQKRELLTVWERDLLGKRALADARVLLQSVRSALDSLDAEDDRRRNREG